MGSFKNVSVSINALMPATLMMKKKEAMKFKNREGYLERFKGTKEKRKML